MDSRTTLKKTSRLFFLVTMKTPESSVDSVTKFYGPFSTVIVWTYSEGQRAIPYSNIQMPKRQPRLNTRDI